jgi:leucyl-tRNA synthetase
MSEFGFPPKFPDCSENEGESEAEKADPAKPGKKVKSKVAAKASSSSRYQWEIMRSLDLDDDDIKAFCDPLHWLEYFPPLAKKDLTALGCRVRIVLIHC